MDELYEVVKRHHSAEKQQRGDQEVPDPQHKGLLPRLRPYQKEAVRWMISRERGERPLVTGMVGWSHGPHLATNIQNALFVREHFVVMVLIYIKRLLRNT